MCVASYETPMLSLCCCSTAAALLREALSPFASGFPLPMADDHWPVTSQEAKQRVPPVLLALDDPMDQLEALEAASGTKVRVCAQVEATLPIRKQRVLRTHIYTPKTLVNLRRG